MPITREEIAWSYRLILGREATEHDLDVWRDVPSLAEMRRLCLTSGEFRSSLDNSAADTVDASLTNVKPRPPSATFDVCMCGSVPAAATMV